MVQVTWTQTAEDDLAAVRDWIGRDFEALAEAFVARIVAASMTLGELPDRGRVVPERGAENIREIFVASYRLIYRIQPDEIEVVTVIHGARILDPKDIT